MCKEVGGYLTRCARIAASIALNDESSVTQSPSQSLTHEGRYRAARAAKNLKCINLDFLQECSLDMIVGTNDMKTVSLQSDQLWLKQAKDMTLFRITEQRFSFINAINPEQGIQMAIVLKRKIMAKLLTTFFPSILLTLITFATTLFKPIYFEASLSVNLTTMLVMTTIFISKILLIINMNI